MDSPQQIGDTTTNSIVNQLSGTHIQKSDQTPRPNPSSTNWSGRVSAATYLGQKFLQLSIKTSSNGNSGAKSDDLGSSKIVVLRRVHDSYINIVQMLQTVSIVTPMTSEQMTAFLENEVLSSSQYVAAAGGSSVDDFSSDENPYIRGVWIPYDKTVALAHRVGVYDIVKGLFLVDVHDFDRLPPAPPASAGALGASVNSVNSAIAAPDDSPSKRRKLSTTASVPLLRDAALANHNAPFTLPPLAFEEKDVDLVADVKLKFSKVFKHDESSAESSSTDDVRRLFAPIVEKCSARSQPLTSIVDVPLDPLGKTALHYAAALASPLVGSFVRLGLCSPVRGDNDGESPLVAAIKVTNAMEKGNYVDMLSTWLWPNLWLLDFANRSIFHHLVLLATTNPRSAAFYLNKTVEWLVTSPDKASNLRSLSAKILDAQDGPDGNTALHIAAHHGLKWFVYVLVELNADANVNNHVGVRPSDYDCVKDILRARESFSRNVDSVAATNALLTAVDSSSDGDEYIVHLLYTAVDFVRRTASFADAGAMEEVSENEEKVKEIKEEKEETGSTGKIFRSIQELLSNTNSEYEQVILRKKSEINALNQELRNATLITANNRYTSKKIMEKVAQVDTLKLQIANLSEKLHVLRKATPSNGADGPDSDVFSEDGDAVDPVKFDADEPFIIRPIFEKLANNENIEPTQEVLDSLPSTDILNARLKAYREVNGNLEKELQSLLNYSTLTAKFKKVVSYCTGVDINEVDELLDGLLEAVEGQQ